jgi:tetratricopeptide (TPR) repeat protein
MSRLSELLGRLAVAGAVMVLGPGYAAAAEEPAGSAATEATRAEAREAFRTGSALARREVWVDALASFERSQRLLPHPVTAYNIGYCERALGRLTRARRMFAKALADAGAPGAPRLPPEIERATLAYEIEIERRLVRVAVTLPAAATALAVDGRPLEVDPGASASIRLVAGTREPGPGERPPASFELLIDPGVHVFVVTAAGAPQVVSRSFAAGAMEVLALDPVADPPERRAERDARRVWATLAYGVGAAGLAVGAFAGAGAIHQKSALDGACGLTKKACPAAFQGGIDALHTDAAVSTAGLVMGGLGVAAGSALVATLLAGKNGPPSPKSARVTPVLGLGAVALRGVFP